MQHIAIFASGSGTNAQKIIEYFLHHESIKVALVVCNRADAGAIKIADSLGVAHAVVSKAELNDEIFMCELLAKHHISFIVLAGFLLLIPSFLIRKFPSAILNIHPALLPKYGGKGMFGKHVHEAVFQNKESETGITIHFANEHYDKGAVVFQQSVALQPNDTPETIARKVQHLEHIHYAPVIESVIKSGR